MVQENLVYKVKQSKSVKFLNIFPNNIKAGDKLIYYSLVSMNKPTLDRVYCLVINLPFLSFLCLLSKYLMMYFCVVPKGTTNYI